MGRKKTILLAVLALIPLTVGVVAHLIETDEEQIERVLDEAVRAAIAGDAEAVIQRVTSDATGGGWIREGELLPRMQYLVGEAHGRVESASLDLKRLEVEGDDARGTWHGGARLKRGQPLGRALFEVAIDFRRVGESWLIRRVVISRR